MSIWMAMLDGEALMRPRPLHWWYWHGKAAW